MAVLNYTPQSGVLPVKTNRQRHRSQQGRGSGIPASVVADWAQENPVEAILTASSLLPGIGDIAGVGADVTHFFNNPDEITPVNVGMSVAGVAPMMPNYVATKAMLGALGAGAALSKLPGMIPNSKGSTILGANVFQGGPNKYGPEGAAKSLDFIGKGEGAQAYGYGRYDAEAENVARKYQKDLSSDVFVEADGRVFDPSTLEHVNVRAGLNKHGGDIDALKLEHAERGIVGPNTSPEVKAMYDRDMAVLDGLQAQGGLTKEAGYLYKHDLPDEDIARYMDWDAPLSEQPESVRAALESVGIRYDADARTRADDIIKRMDEIAADRLPSNRMREEKEWFRLANERDALLEKAENPTGADVYKSLNKSAGYKEFFKRKQKEMFAAKDFSGTNTAEKLASQFLGEQGVPGLKYYDGMSRNAGEGTRNYVTWDQDVLNRMKLLERNGELMGVLPTPKK